VRQGCRGGPGRFAGAARWPACIFCYPPTVPDERKARAAEDLIDAALGLDRRAWVTLRDLLVRPWVLIARTLDGPDPRYVGPIKLALSVAAASLLLVSWLLPERPVAQLVELKSGPAAAEALLAELGAHGVAPAHFDERFASRQNAINVALTLVECLAFSALLAWFERRRPFLGHLAYALIMFTLWVLVGTLIVVVVIAVPTEVRWFHVAAEAVMLLLLPGLLIAGLPRFYPAPWPRQAARALVLVLVALVLLAVAFEVLMVLALAWTKASFGM